MTKRFLFRLALLTVLGSASVLAFSVPSSFREIHGHGADAAMIARGTTTTAETMAITTAGSAGPRVCPAATT